MRAFLVTALAVAILLTSLDVVDFGPSTAPQDRREVERHMQTLLRATCAREKAVQDLIAGRRTFPEAAARFRQIALLDPPGVNLLRVHCPNCSEEELHFRQVLFYLQANPIFPGAEDAFRKFSSELEERRNNGTLHLPEINEPPPEPCPEYQRTIMEGIARPSR